MAAIVGALFGKAIDGTFSVIDKKITIEGKKDIIREEAEASVKKTYAEGKVKADLKILDNEREDHHEDHIRKMEDIKNNQIYRMEKLNKDHEINVSRQNAENRKLEEEMKIKADDHHESNKREMAKINNDFELKMTYAKADIEEKTRKLNIEESKENHRSEAEILKINKDSEIRNLEIQSDMEKFRLNNNNTIAEIQNKHKIDLENIEIKKKEENNNFLTKNKELDYKRDKEKEENLLKREKEQNRYNLEEKKLTIEIEKLKAENNNNEIKLRNQFDLEKMDRKNESDKLKMEWEEKNLKIQKDIKELELKKAKDESEKNKELEDIRGKYKKEITETELNSKKEFEALRGANEVNLQEAKNNGAAKLGEIENKGKLIEKLNADQSFQILLNMTNNTNSQPQNQNKMPINQYDPRFMYNMNPPMNICYNNQGMYSMVNQPMNGYNAMYNTPMNPMNPYINCQQMYNTPIYNKPMNPYMNYQQNFAENPQKLDSSMQINNSNNNITASCPIPVMS